MIRTIGAAAMMALAVAATAPEAKAQDGAIGGAIVGGALGGIIGGAATGRAGGAAAGAIIGGATGAVIGAESDRRRAGAGYFWYEGRCFYRYPHGETIRVQRSNCY